MKSLTYILCIVLDVQNFTTVGFLYSGTHRTQHVPDFQTLRIPTCLHRYFFITAPKIGLHNN